MQRILYTLLFLTIMMSFGTKTVFAFEQVTSKEAYDLIVADKAVMLDIRSFAELTWVGSPALIAGGEPISFFLPLAYWRGIDEKGEDIWEPNMQFEDVILQKFGDDLDQKIIIICRSGHRSNHAAEKLEAIGFTDVSEVENVLNEEATELGGRGGVQGTSYDDSYNGYRGYPGRLPKCRWPSKKGGDRNERRGCWNPNLITVETDSTMINNVDDSVSWLDTGLPFTQKVDPTKILGM